MNRRQFFGMTAAAVAAAGLPALVLPRKTIFLPPRWGWKPHELGAGYMREASQYVINADAMAWRYDAIGRDIWGEEHQVYVMNSGRIPPEVAAAAIADRFRREGLTAIHPDHAKVLRMALPYGIPTARYI